TRCRGSDDQIEIGHRRSEFGHELAAKPYGLDVISTGDQRSKRHAVAKGFAVIDKTLAQRRLVDRVALSEHDHDATSRPVGERRDAEFAHRAAEILENLYGSGDPLPGCLVHRIVGLVEMADQTNAQPFDLT